MRRKIKHHMIRLHPTARRGQAAYSHTLLLKALILHATWNKPWGHDLAGDVIPLNRVMSEIGG